MIADGEIDLAAIAARIRAGEPLGVPDVNALVAYLQEIDANTKEQMVKRLFHEIKKQLSQLESARADRDTPAEASRRAANARSLATLVKTLERVVQFEQQLVMAQEMKVTGSNDEIRAELERRLDQCLAARRALPVPGEPQQ